MECNREEAMRAKAIAEKKMESKDFVGARKVALKAKQLYSEVENISQMLLVCDVHCSAAKQLMGGDKDWYGILQVQKTVDEATVKKQYRKFALLLHPDKNKFPGAEGAFKLIGEAQRILLDKEKRRYHDVRNGPTIYRPPHHTSVVPNTYRSHPSVPNFRSQQPQPPAQPGYSDPNATFWTVCPFCSVRYQYYKDVMNRSIRCQHCSKPFVAYDMNVASSANFSKPVFPQPPMSSTHKAEARFQRNFGTGNSRAESFQNASKHTGRIAPDVGTRKVNHKREKKRARDQSDSDPELSDSISDSEEEMGVDNNGNVQGARNSGYQAEENVRRSSRHKQKVSYKENVSDSDNDYVGVIYDQASERAKRKKRSLSVTEEENGDAPKEEAAKMNCQTGFGAETEEDREEGKQKEGDEEEFLPNGHEAKKREGLKDPVEECESKKSFEAHVDVDLSSEEEDSELSLSYPDPEFSNFDEDRKAECFAVGQLWAAYDTQGAMPRFYALIKKVFSPGFKVQINWLEADPDNVNEIKWRAGDLPFSCGKFKIGGTEKTDNLPMFSHRMVSVEGSCKGPIVIHPLMGETWALFKDWDIKWSCDPVARHNSEYEYEFVVILSDYSQGVGIRVGLLTKVEGFVSLFCRTDNLGKNTFIIPPGELLRLSHRIPSYKMKGNEAEGVPKDSFELDPAALPIKVLGSPMSRDKAKPMAGCASDSKGSHLEPQKNGSSAPSASTSEATEIPESEFFNFDAEKSKDKLQTGQVWAFYSDEDGLPKYYGRIKEVQLLPKFEVQVSWLALSPGKNVIRWSDHKMPISCGVFKLGGSASQVYNSSGSFSHKVSIEIADKRNIFFSILPRKGEVWALYRNWRADMKASSLRNCEYDIVEVLGCNDLQTEVLLLDRVPKFNSVFKPRVEEGSSVAKRTISREELLRFSHQIPAFHLTGKEHGRLQGFWELDPAAFPVHFFHSS